MRAYLSLGSNLGSPWGDPAATVARGVAELALLPGVRVSQRSHCYRTSPVGMLEQPDFANLVVEVETTIGAAALLHACLEIEDRFGRRRLQSSGPRSLDIDLLFYGDEHHDLPGLRVPHPRLHGRRFVLVPLGEIRPQLRHPLLGSTVAELLAGLDDDASVERWPEVSAGEPAIAGNLDRVRLQQ